MDEQSKVKPFTHVLNELAMSGDILLRQARIMIPVSLQHSVLSIEHEGHLGISKTKSLLRTKVWFLGMDRKVEDLIANFLACQLNAPSVNEPIKSTEMHREPWQF
jgi:hypothetical protein